jgi:hypothetical protein
LHVELREQWQAKFEEWELSASTGSCGMLVHADSKVEQDQWETTDDRRTYVYEGLMRATTVWK